MTIALHKKKLADGQVYYEADIHDVKSVLAMNHIHEKRTCSDFDLHVVELLAEMHGWAIRIAENGETVRYQSAPIHF